MAVVGTAASSSCRRRSPFSLCSALLMAVSVASLPSYDLTLLIKGCGREGAVRRTLESKVEDDGGGRAGSRGGSGGGGDSLRMPWLLNNTVATT